jgi:alkylation response protein AidB-like acyl-CoA dehydrogenase
MPPRRFWTRAGEIGILGIGVTVEYGGLPESTRYMVIDTRDGRG